MVITMPAAVAVVTGQQAFLLAMAVLEVVAPVDRKVLAQPALEEVLRLTVEQMVTKVTLIQEILPVVPQVLILEVVAEVQAKVNINHIQELVVLADRVQWSSVTQIHMMPHPQLQVAQL
jgi:hypothetical protein